MQRYLLTIIITLLTTTLTLPATTVKGTLHDKTTNEPIGYANISLKDGNGTLITGAVTDDKGTFSLTAPAGQYTFEASFIGYQTYTKNIKATTDATINLGTIYLQENTQELAEVEVVSQGTQMKLEIDKKVFSVDQALAAAGASVSEVLQNIPSVNVDGEGNVSLRNNTNVEIWINGRPAGLTEDNRAQILEQMPAGSIESVELITNPSAKYSPEGTAGVINLVMKKKTSKTYYGSVSAGIQWPIPEIPGCNIGASFNYNSEKVDFYFNLGLDYKNRVSGYTMDRYALNESDTTSLLSTLNKTLNNRKGIFGRAGVDWHITENNTLSLSGFGMYNLGRNNTNINYQNYTYPTPVTLTRNYSRDNNGKNKFPLYVVELDYEHKFDKKGSLLTAGISVHQHGHTSTTDYLQHEYTATDTILSGNDIQYSGNSQLRLEGTLDFVWKFTEKRKIEAGWESDWSHHLSNDSARNSLTNQPIPGFFNKFDYQEQIHALYITYGDMFGHFSMQLGLRGEYMKVDAATTSGTGTEKFSREYWQLFPSAFFAYEFPKHNELQINYTRRVNRPRGRQINPYKNFSDSTNILYGNPSLNPQFSSAVELNYLKTWDNHSLSASAYYHFTDRVIERVSYRNAEVMEHTFVNVTKRQNVGLELVAKNRLWKILNLMTSVNLYYEKLDSATWISPYNDIIQIPQQQGFSWNLRFMASIMATKTTTIQTTFNYRSPHVIAQGKTNHDYSLDLGIRQTFLDGRISLNLTARDILNSRKFRSETWGKNFYQYSERYWSGRTLNLTIAYNFGNLRGKKPNRQQMMQEQESEFGMEDME